MNKTFDILKKITYVIFFICMIHTIYYIMETKKKIKLSHVKQTHNSIYNNFCYETKTAKIIKQALKKYEMPKNIFNSLSENILFYKNKKTSNNYKQFIKYLKEPILKKIIINSIVIHNKKENHIQKLLFNVLIENSITNLILKKNISNLFKTIKNNIYCNKFKKNYVVLKKSFLQ